MEAFICVMTFAFFACFALCYNNNDIALYSVYHFFLALCWGAIILVCELVSRRKDEIGKLSIKVFALGLLPLLIFLVFKVFETNDSFNGY